MTTAPNPPAELPADGEGVLIDPAVMCPRYQQAAELLARRWTVLIVRTLLGGPRRFGELRAVVPGVSDRILSERLKELEVEGIVRREVIPETPVRILYSLTDKGHDLQRVVEEIQRWANKWENPAS
jgi:DNA-binding HxlR family transcriptional regulator